MAVALLTASSEALNLATAPVTAAPLTMACWFNVTNITAAHYLMAISDDGTPNGGRFDLACGGDDPDDPIQAWAASSIATDAAQSTIAYSINTWQHAAGVWASASSRSAYLNAGSKGTNSTSVTPLSVDRLRIGSTADSTQAAFVNGSIAEAAVWNVALTDAEIAILALGYSPLLVRPLGLVFYAPLIRDVSAGAWPEHIGGVALTEVNTPTVGVHTRMFYPSAPMIGPIASAAAITAGEIIAATSPHYDLGAFGPATMVPY